MFSWIAGDWLGIKWRRRWLNWFSFKMSVVLHRRIGDGNGLFAFIYMYRCVVFKYFELVSIGFVMSRWGGWWVVWKMQRQSSLFALESSKCRHYRRCGCVYVHELRVNKEKREQIDEPKSVCRFKHHTRFPPIYGYSVWWVVCGSHLPQLNDVMCSTQGNIRW